MSPEDEENETKEPEKPEEGDEGGAPQEGPEKQSAPEQPSAESPEGAAAQADGAAQFATLTEKASPEAESKKIDFLYDIELDVNVELGRAELKVRDVLSLHPGSVVELNRLAGDPVEVIINNKLIARGEVIVIDENFAIRVTDILSPTEIVSTLGKGY